MTNKYHYTKNIAAMVISESQWDAVLRLASDDFATVEERSLAEQQRPIVSESLAAALIDKTFADAHCRELASLSNRFQNPFEFRDVLNSDEWNRLLQDGLESLSVPKIARLLLSVASIRLGYERLWDTVHQNRVSPAWKMQLDRFDREFLANQAKIEREEPFSKVLVRRGIEMPIVRRAAKLPDVLRFKLVNRLRATVRKHEELLENGLGVDTEEWHAVDFEFHAEIIKAAGSEASIAAFKCAHGQVHDLLKEPRRGEKDSGSQFIDEHVKILRAISQGSLIKVEEAYHEHLMRVAAKLGEEALNVYLDAKFDRELISHVAAQRNQESIHRAFRALRQKDTYIVLVNPDLVLPLEIRDPVVFAADVRRAIDIGATVIYVVDGDVSDRIQFDALFRVLALEVNSVGDALNEHERSRLALVFGDVHSLIEESRYEDIVWPFGITFRESGKILVNCWDSENMFLDGQHRLAKSLVTELPSLIFGLSHSLLGDSDGVVADHFRQLAEQAVNCTTH